jgi:hypothetical protein
VGRVGGSGAGEAGVEVGDESDPWGPPVSERKE